MATVHIVGAGLAGLSAAVRLARAGRRVRLFEAASQAGGRCRSFFDRTLDRQVDNGNHLLLSGNRSAMAYLRLIGAAGRFVGPDQARFPFHDLASGAGWCVQPNSGPVPWWVLSRRRGIPGVAPAAWLSALRLRRAGPAQNVAQCVGDTGTIFRRFWEPLAVSALNLPADRAAAGLLWPVIAETFARGGRACLPRIAEKGLSDSFIDPATRFLEARGGRLHYGARLKAITLTSGAARGLEFADETVALDADDQVILALPSWSLGTLLPDLPVPDGSNAILGVHFRLPTGRDWGDTPFIGLIGGKAQWIFMRGDVVSITTSAADDLIDRDAARLAALVWPEVRAALGLGDSPLPPYRVIKEKRATFCQSPDQIVRRPGAESAIANLFLAGDWTDTGLPATMEGAIRSGARAAEIVEKRSPLRAL